MPPMVTAVRLADPGSAQPRSHSLVIGPLRWAANAPPVERAMSHIPGDAVTEEEGGSPHSRGTRAAPVFGPLSRGRSGGGELAEHVVQDAAVHVVLLLLRRVDPHARVERRLLAVRLRRGDADPVDAVAAEPFDIEDLGAVESEALRVLAVEELQRQHAHSDQIRAVDALEAFGEHGTHTEQRGALRRPVARRARAVLLARDHDERRAVLLVAH